MVLVIGPSRVGKTTLIRLLEKRLLASTLPHLQRNPGMMPFASITVTGPGSGRFDWQDYYKAILRQFNDPFVDSATARIPARVLREAVESAFIQRKPVAIIADEAHHLAKSASGRRLQDQLDHLKYFENLTGVSHVLVGTYEMRPFRKVNAQLACRSVDVHFPRYDATKTEDARIFRSVVWALQRQLPVVDEPCLVEQHWEFLYTRSIGCVGLLKLHLDRALNLALTEKARTVTWTHLRKTAMSEARVNLALRTALESEAELTEPAGADERLAALLGLTRQEAKQVPEPASTATGQQPPSPTSERKRQKPGKRTPGRDAIGSAPEQREPHSREEGEEAQ
jgi:hypothetical protein